MESGAEGSGQSRDGHPHDWSAKSVKSESLIVTPRNGTPVEGGLTGRWLSAERKGWADGHPGAFDDAELLQLFSGASFQVLGRGSVVHQVGAQPDGLLQVVSGRLQVEVVVPGRMRAKVVGSLGPGDVMGERALLQGTPARSRVVVQSAEAAIAKLSLKWLATLQRTEPRVSAVGPY